MTIQNIQVNHGEEHHHYDGSNQIFGFWVYIMSDCILFAIIFASYAVLHNNVFGGPTAKELFNLPFVLTETFILLTSSFTYGLAMLGMNKNKKSVLIFWSIVTLLLGVAFIYMELYEFHHLYIEGNSWSRSAFLSAFFTLVGTHGLHVTVGIIWMIVSIFQIFRLGLTDRVKAKLSCLSLFWHFLDIVWIFVFTIVYLMGAI